MLIAAICYVHRYPSEGRRGGQPCDLSDRTRLIFRASPEREQFLCCEIGCNFCLLPLLLCVSRHLGRCWSVCIKREKQHFEYALRISILCAVKLTFSASLGIGHISVEWKGPDISNLSYVFSNHAEVFWTFVTVSLVFPFRPLIIFTLNGIECCDEEEPF